MRWAWIGLAAALLAGAAQAQADGVSGWREDLRIVRSEFLVRDRAYTPETRAQAEALVDQLSRDVPRLSDVQLQAGLARVAALSGNAHTRAYLLRNAGLWRRYPLRLWKFADGWRVIAARPEHAELVGARLLSVAGRSTDRAEAAVRPLFAGNDNWAEYMAGYSFTSPDALIGAGLVRGDADGVLGFEKDGRRFTRRLAAEPFERRNGVEETWWFLSPAHPATRGWTHALQGRPLPPVLAGAAQSYRLLRCGGAAYLQVNRADDAPGETLQAFNARVLEALRTDPPQRLVVDLRFNTGGDLSKSRGFFDALAASPIGQDHGRMAVIIGPTTFSAGITAAAQLRQGSKALFAGTSPGDALETWSEGGRIRLPHSQVDMRFTARAHTYSRAAHGVPADLVHLDLDVAHLLPDRPADWSWTDYIAGRDPYTEAALGAPLICG